MKHRVAILAAAALVVAACGGESVVETTAVPDVVETTVTAAAPTTTAAPEAPTTTNAPETTTTTAAPALEASVNPQLRRIQAAMAQSTEVPSARMVGDIRIIGIEDFDGEISFSFEGAFDNRTGDSSFSLDLSSFADVISAQLEAESTGTPEDEFGAAFMELFLGMFTQFEVRQVGDTVYMNNPMLVSFAGGDTEWIASPASESGDIASGFLQDSPTTPADVLDPFQNGNAEVIEIGPELVRGEVETTHYQLVYDKESLLESAPAGERAELEQELEQFGEDLVIDVWMDDQYLYKVFFDIDGTEFESEEGDSFERMTMTYEIFDYGADIVIEAPPADQVTFVEEEELSPGLGFGFND